MGWMRGQSVADGRTFQSRCRGCGSLRRMRPVGCTAEAADAEGIAHESPRMHTTPIRVHSWRFVDSLLCVSALNNGLVKSNRGGPKSTPGVRQPGMSGSARLAEQEAGVVAAEAEAVAH